MFKGFSPGIQDRDAAKASGDFKTAQAHNHCSGFELAHASYLGSSLSHLHTELGLPETYQPPHLLTLIQSKNGAILTP